MVDIKIDDDNCEYIGGDLPFIRHQDANNGPCLEEWLPLVGIPDVLRKIDSRPDDPWSKILYESALTVAHLVYYSLPPLYAILQELK